MDDEKMQGLRLTRLRVKQRLAGIRKYIRTQEKQRYEGLENYELVEKANTLEEIRELSARYAFPNFIAYRT